MGVTQLKSINQNENNYRCMFSTEVYATIRFNFSVFNLWIEPNTFWSPDGKCMLNDVLEKFPSYILMLSSKPKTQNKLFRIGLI